MSDFFFFFRIGWEHIININALDHILFIAALAVIYMFYDWKQVLVLVTAFTLGHAITLLLSAKNIVNVNEKWIEFLIPCTIMLTALSNLFQRQFNTRSIRINYVLALFFGLIHGLAYANTLKWMLADDQNFVISWLGFSVGLELGQILVVLFVLSVAFLVVQVLKLNRRIWVWIISIAVAIFAAIIAIDRLPKVDQKRAAFSGTTEKGRQGDAQRCESPCRNCLCGSKALAS